MGSCRRQCRGPSFHIYISEQYSCLCCTRHVGPLQYLWSESYSHFTDGKTQAPNGPSMGKLLAKITPLICDRTGLGSCLADSQVWVLGGLPCSLSLLSLNLQTWMKEVIDFTCGWWGEGCPPLKPWQGAGLIGAYLLYGAHWAQTPRIRPCPIPTPRPLKSPGLVSQ